MELADEKSQAAYEKLRADGLRGVPREELLSHMRDAADAPGLHL